MPTVLLVDDSNMIRMILKGLLTQLQISTIVEAPNGQEALSILAANRINLVLLDLHMPVMDGENFLVKLRADPAWRDLPVVIISSDSDPEQVTRMQTLGVKAFIQKPFRLEGLQQALVAAGQL
ncbi:MAG: response regulator [Planctomycetota bacterium]